MKYPAVTSRNVLVTGCSSGIGLATARLLRDRGWLVLPTARKPEDLERLRTEDFEPIRLDIADSHSVQEAAAEALRICGGRLGALVNNAGLGQPGAMEDLTRDAMRYQFDVNVFGLQELTNKFIPLFRKQGFGRIVNISSCLGRVSIPFMGIYAASKFAVEAMSDALRVELFGSGIAVSIVEPGPIETAFRQNSLERARTQMDRVDSHFADRYQRRIEGTDPERKLSRLFTQPPEAVARRILHALQSPRPKIRYAVTFPAHLLNFLRRFAPDALVDWMVSWRLSE
ncbi:MAG: SDR family NAD(P)-dependent oxidoreductase [Verrucomicrobiota bacterium]